MHAATHGAGHGEPTTCAAQDASLEATSTIEAFGTNSFRSTECWQGTSDTTGDYSMPAAKGLVPTRHNMLAK